MKITYSNSSIGSIVTLAKTLDVSEQLLHQIAADPLAYYSISQIVKKNGGIRIISDPVKELKIIQRRIVRRIFSKCTFPSYLFGSIKDVANPRDFVRNAQAHVNALEVMTFDIESFFPNVKPRFIKRVFKFLLKLPDDVAELLVSLTTLNNGLPQGAPTSSYLANMIFYDNEHKYEKVFASKKFIYTRLVDDITISSSQPIDGLAKKFIYTQIMGLLSEKDLTICKEKYKATNTSVIGRKSVVTGLVVESNIVKLPREQVKRIGHLVYELKNNAEISTTDQEYHQKYGKASGLVALYKRLTPKKADICRSQLREILPTYEQKKIKKISWLCRKFIKYAQSHSDQLALEGYAKKYYRYKQRLSIMRRTNRKLAAKLENELRPFKPLFLLASYHE